MSNNPYESPTAAPEKGVKRRGPVPWVKGLVMGVVSWIAVIAVIDATWYAYGSSALHQLVQTIAWLVGAPLWFVTGYGRGVTLIAGLLSGILLHAAFWTAVFTLWRRWAGAGEAEAGKVSEG